MKTVFLALACLMVMSCSKVSLTDSSLEPAYANVIGKKFRTRVELWALGIISDENYKKEVDYIVLVPGVGFSGTEVIVRERFPKGSIIKVARVLTTKSSMLSRVIYVVEEVGSNQFEGLGIRVRMTGAGIDSNGGLDSKFYEELL